MKNNQGLKKLFIDELEDMLSAENQIIKSLPKLIKLVNSADLKKALTNHLKETEHQVKRIEEIFSILGLPSKEKHCNAMEGLLKEADEIIKGKTTSFLLDAAIISAAQKVEHYEIATYGTLRSFARHLDLDSKIVDLLTESIDEEGGADKAMTKIADGSVFKTGINDEAIAELAGKK